VGKIVLLGMHCFQRIPVESIYSMFLTAVNNLHEEIEKPFKKNNFE